MSSATNHTDVLGASPSAYSSPHSACASLAMQHCTTASVEVVKLPVPPQEYACSAVARVEKKRAGAGREQNAPAVLDLGGGVARGISRALLPWPPSAGFPRG